MESSLSITFVNPLSSKKVKKLREKAGFLMYKLQI